jgi:hypothetical protein
MAAHPVSHHPQAGLWFDKVVVFVVIANTALVAHTEALDGKGDSVQIATKRFVSVLCDERWVAYSAHFATSVFVRVSK